jgi:serine/threonine protein kinase/tetratricopeptide (TPR) repeat protein
MANEQQDSNSREERVNDAIAAYFQVADAGQAPSRQDFLGQHPDLAVELAAFFADRDKFHELADPIRPLAEPHHAPAGTSEHAVSIPGYQLLAELARGGMGVVFKGFHPRLGRDLAIKVLRAPSQQAANEPNLRRRFLQEAQIAGQLQHPGIAPVYDLGETADALPYFTMKLVQGRTLAALLAERPDPEHDRQRFLLIFEQICQTLAYAHARGVIHRDLKPSNIMLGAFGEVQVMDWGLAKVVGSGQGVVTVSDESAADRSNSEKNHATAVNERETLPGQPLGTPAYMAPEQARGEVERLDERCDVFGLGAILCETLTGRPPFVGKNRLDVLQKAREGDLAESLARLDSCGAQTDLLRLAKSCLAVAPEDRPRDAGVVTKEMTNHLVSVANRLREAELAAARATAEAQQQRRAAEHQRKLRRRTLAMAASVLVTLVGGIIGTTIGLVDAERARQSAETAEINERKEREEAVASAAKAKEAAEAEKRHKERADASYHLAKHALDDCMAKLRADERFQHGEFENVRVMLNQVEKEFYEKFVEQRGDNPKFRAERARAFFRLGYVTAELTSKAEAIPVYEQGRDLWAELVRDYPQDPGYKRELAASHNNLGKLYGDTSRPKEAEQAHKEALALSKALAEQHPGVARYRTHLAKTHHHLGVLYQRSSRLKEAEQAHEEALALQRALAEQHPNVAQSRADVAQSLICLGSLYGTTSRPKQAEQAYREALGVLKLLTEQHPGVAPYLTDLGMTHNNLANLYWATSQPKKAEQAYREALAIQTPLAEQHPSVADYRAELARTNNNLGNLFRATGRPKEAEEAYGDAHRLQKALAERHPSVARYRLELARTYNNLGALFRDISRDKQAEQAYGEAVLLFKALAEQDPDVAEYRADLAGSHHNLANLYLDTSRSKEAEQAYREALNLYNILVEQHPSVARFAIGLGGTQGDLGDLACDSKRFEAGFSWYAQAIATLEAVLAKQQHPDARQFLRDAHWGRATTLTQLGRYAEALKDWERALKLADGRSRNRLLLQRALTLARLKEHAKATAEADALAQAKEASADALYNAACVYSVSSWAVGDDAKQAEQYAARAVALLQQAVAKGYKNVEHLKKDSDLDVLRQREDYKKLLRELHTKE